MKHRLRKAVWTSLLVPWLMGGRCAPPDEVCGDGVDNDEDGDTDCGDYDCSSRSECRPREADCNDDDDNDEDGDTDCEDLDCVGDFECREWRCDDGRDDDDDGDTDCGDSDCAGRSVCSGGDGTGGNEATGGSSSGGTSSGGTSSGGAASGGLGGEPLGGAAGASSGGDGGQLDTCPSAIEVDETTGFTGMGYLADFADFAAGSCQADGAGADILFSYSAAQPGTLTVGVYSTLGNVDVSLRSDCADPDSELACAATDPAGMIEEVSVEVEADETTFIILSGADAGVVESVYLSVELD